MSEFDFLIYKDYLGGVLKPTVSSTSLWLSMGNKGDTLGSQEYNTWLVNAILRNTQGLCDVDFIIADSWPEVDCIECTMTVEMAWSATAWYTSKKALKIREYLHSILEKE